MADDGWEDVTDPLEMKKVLGVSGAAKLTGLGGGSTGDQKSAAKSANLDALVNQINRVQQLYDVNLKGSGLGSISEYLPTPTNSQFNSAAAGLAEQGLAAFRVPGVGSQSDTELRQFVEANRPQNTDFDLSIEEKLRQLRSRTDATREAMGLDPAAWMIGGRTTSSPAGSVPPPGPTGVDRSTAPVVPNGPDTGLMISNSSGQPIVSERDTRLNALANAILARGGTADEANQIAASMGFGGANGGPVFDPAQWNEALRYNRTAGPNAGRATVAAGATGVSDPTLLNRAAGSAGGELARGYLNGVSAGLLDEGAGAIDSLLTGQPLGEAVAEADLKKQVGAEAFPTANLLGNLGGGVTASLAGGGLLGRVAPKLAKAVGGSRALSPGPLLADAAYGSLYGAGENNDDRLSGAGIGAISGAAGGALGRGGFNAAGKAFTGARGVSQDFLRSRGVPMTLGQTLGGRARAMEEKLPFVRGLIANRESEGMDEFNRAAFSELSNEITSPGSAGVTQAGPVVKKAYNKALNGVSIVPDQQLLADIASARAAGSAVPGLGENFNYLMKNQLDPLMSGPSISGEQVQDALRQIRNRKTAFGKMDGSGANPMAGDTVAALQAVEDALLGSVQRQSPSTIPALNEANRLYAMKKTLEDAVLRANANGGIFSPAQLGAASIANAKKFGGKAAAAEGKRPFFDLERAGQEVLPQKVPNSGTVDRALVAAMLPAAVGGTGAGFGLIDPSTAALIASLSLPFTKVGQKATVAAISKRSPGAIAMGQGLKKKARVGGMFGGATLTQQSQR